MSIRKAMTIKYDPSRLFSNISIWLACAMAIVSIKPWFAWGRPFDTLFSLLFIASRVFVMHKKYPLRNILIVETFLLFGIFYSQLFLIPLKTSIIRILVTIIPIALFLLTSREERKIFLRRLIRVFSIILLVSLAGFTLQTLGFDLPYSLLMNPNPFYEPYKNYYFFTVYKDLDVFTRFTSMFAEPGHVGMVCSILLYANGYTLRKKSNILMTIALIWSFSLAGFMMYVAGLVMYLIAKAKRPGTVMVKLSLALACVAGVAIATYSPTNDDVVTQLILKRLEFDSSKGLAGNNRNTGNFEYVYDNFTKNHELALGMGTTEYSRRFYGTANSSYKTFVLEYGAGSMVTLILFILVFFGFYPTKQAAGLIILLTLSFWQRPYFLWFIECFTFFSVVPLYISLKRSINLPDKINKQRDNSQVAVNESNLDGEP